MRIEQNCECPKCGYKFIDVSNCPPFTWPYEEQMEWIGEQQKLKKEGKICAQHSIYIEDGKCEYCEKEKKINEPIRI